MTVTTTHKTTIVGKCPHGCDDLYAAAFTTDRLVRCEDIDAAIGRLTAEPTYQEDLTRRLAEVLRCRVVLVGRHGRFKTTSEAGA